METVAGVDGGLATLIFGDLTSNVPLGYSVSWTSSLRNLNACILDAPPANTPDDLQGLPVYNGVLSAFNSYPENYYRTQNVRLVRDSDQAVVSEYRFCNTFV